MTPCARGCCFTGLQVCARQRACPCHAADTPTNEPQQSDARRHRDPTADEAIRRTMNAQQRRKPR